MSPDRTIRRLTNRWSGRVKDKVPSPYIGARRSAQPLGAKTMKGLRYLLLLPLALLAATSASSPPDTSSREEVFSKALLLMERGQYAEAIPIFESLARERKSDSLLWNLGIAASETHANDKALSAWLEFRKLAPDDWRGRAKLIQAYQAAGDLKARDEQRAELLQLWKEGKNSDLAAQSFYCREQIIEANRRVFAFEYFRPTGDYMIFYSFEVRAPGLEDFKITLGSYEGTNQVMWETGKLKRDERLYHLDLYQPKRHETYAFYNSRPSYEAVRENVMSILSGSLKPMSSTSER
jgi:tetratricopeptide (TPR) repeat protein